MDFTGFADESGIHRRRSPCYSIGCFVVPTASVGALEGELRGILEKYGVNDELKWTKIDSYRARRLAAVDGIRVLLTSDARFHAIVVNKSLFRKWDNDPEDAFYHTYYQLSRSVSRQVGSTIALKIDHRSDRYARRAEVLEIVTNRALAKIESSGAVGSVEMIDSKRHLLLQYTDVLVGAITSATNLHLDSSLGVNEGKAGVIAQIAAMVGWTELRHNTYPSERFNIWHFPTEFTRASTPQPVVLPSRGLAFGSLEQASA